MKEGREGQYELKGSMKDSEKSLACREVLLASSQVDKLVRQ